MLSFSEIHPFTTSLGSHLFVVDGSRVYDMDEEIAKSIEVQSENSILENLGLSTDLKYIDKAPLSPPDLYSISLNIAQACNMSCSYCYADTGKFKGRARMMQEEVAFATVDRLFEESTEGASLVLGYMGGEPLLDKDLIHKTTKYAAKKAEKTSKKIRFSLTTNGTLIEPQDAELFSTYPFTVSISVDGNQKQNDAHRKMNNNTSSYESLSKGLDILNRYGRPKHLSARATVSPKTGKLLPILEHLISVGFDDVGFSAIVTSPIPSLAFSEEDFNDFLQYMIECGQKTYEQILEGKKYPFSNFETALYQIHRGTHRPYPCGAGAGYLSANAEGKLFACHRLIDDQKYEMGNVKSGSSISSRSSHLRENHVDNIEGCKVCWARYLCGGGCYHEVSNRGRVACDYIRGWLNFCLQSYSKLSHFKPDYFLKK